MQIQKFSWGTMPPDPPSGPCFACSPRSSNYSLAPPPLFSLQILSHSFADNRRNEKSGFVATRVLLCLMGLRPCTCSGKLTTLTEKHRVTNGIKYGDHFSLYQFPVQVFNPLFWDHQCWPRLLLHYSSFRAAGSNLRMVRPSFW